MIEDLDDEIADVLAQEPGVAAAYVYGSRARATSTPLSDVDIALVAVEQLDSAARGLLLRRATTRLQRRRPGTNFDVRLLDELPAAIAGRVVTEGRRVYENDPVARVRAEVQARMLYHDFLPFERIGTKEGLDGLRRSFDVGR